MGMTALQVEILKRRLRIGGLTAVAAIGAGFWLLVHPENPLTDHFSSPITVRDTRVIVGPYPDESDFGLLARNGVRTIVSLLDPGIPYERILLDRERTAAAAYALQFYDFPMASVFGHPFGGDYGREAASAAQTISHSSGRVYLHSYLGVHRVASVEALLSRFGPPSGVSLVRHGERSPDARLLDQAQSRYEAGDYRGALRALFNITNKTEASQLLEGWATYHLDDIAMANADFASVYQFNPRSQGAALGLGYCALRTGHLGGAADSFARVLSANPRDESALTGMGLTLYREGHWPEASHYLRAALAIDPHDADARSELARMN